MKRLAFLLLIGAALGACATASPPAAPAEAPSSAGYEAVRTRYHAALSTAATEFPSTCSTGEAAARIEAARTSLKTLGADFYKRGSERGEWTPPPMVMLKQRQCSEAGAFAAELQKAVEDFRFALARY